MWFQEPLADIDELILRCRDDKTRHFLAEATACYKAGAFRAAIVSTWIAVVFDFIAKLCELDRTGDVEARNLLAEFERVEQEKDIKIAIPLAQALERTLLEKAKDQFELLSSLEYKDLLRLHEDRHRCAHPSMHSIEDPYQPTGELVRYHLRNAVEFLLQHPPVQGKAAEERIWDDIHSEYFPATLQEAVSHFARGPLARVKLPLLRRLIIGLTKSLLRDVCPQEEQKRKYAALGAILQIHSQTGKQVLQDELPTIVSRIEDESWPSVISYISTITPAWEALGEANRNKTLRFLQSCPDTLAEQTFTEALKVPTLKNAVCEHLVSLSLESLSVLLSQALLPEYFEEALRRLATASTFDEAKETMDKTFFPFRLDFTASQINRILEIYPQNNQLYNSFRAQTLIERLFQQSEQFLLETREAWIHLYEQRCQLIGKKLTHLDEWALLTSIEHRYPDAITLATEHLQERYAQADWEEETE